MMRKLTIWLWVRKRLRSAVTLAQSEISYPHEKKLKSSITLWAHSEYWSNRADVQADLSLHWTHSHFVDLSCHGSIIMKKIQWVSHFAGGKKCVKETMIARETDKERWSHFSSKTCSYAAVFEEIYYTKIIQFENNLWWDHLTVFLHGMSS